MSKRLLDITEILVSEGYVMPLDVAITLMGSGYMVKDLEDLMIDGYQVIDDVVQSYEDVYE
jgi:hypothetical protein